jgi:uncharacterized protein YkwD
MTKDMILKLKNLFVPYEANNFRPKFLQSRYLAYYLILLLVLKLTTFPLLACFPKTTFFADISEKVLINLTNEDRTSQGLVPLQENSKLSEAAYLKAKDMMDKGYFSHQSPEGVTPWYWIKKAGYDYKFAGENLAIGFLDSQEVFNAWMLSLPHQKNVLNPNYKEMGIAVLKGNFQGNETAVVVQLFGSSLPKETPVISEVEAKTEETDKGTTTVAPSERQQPTIGQEQIKENIEEPQQEVLSARTNGDKDTLGFKMFSFISLYYYDFLQKIIYGSLILIIVSLFMNIFIRYDVQCPDLIFKTLFFILLLVFFIFLDKNVIVGLIPHGFSIY